MFGELLLFGSLLMCFTLRAEMKTRPLLKSRESRLHQLIVKSAGVFWACEGPVLGFSSCQ